MKYLYLEIVICNAQLYLKGILSQLEKMTPIKYGKLGKKRYNLDFMIKEFKLFGK